MTTALVVSPEQTEWAATQLAALRQLGLEDASKGDLTLFLHYAQRTGLDPFSRQIYMIGRWSSKGTKYTIQSSIDGLRIIAQRSGEYAGQTAPMWCGSDGVWKDVWLDAAPPVAAKIGVYRVGFTEPLIAVARLESYMPMTKDGRPSGLWGTMPDVMLAKVAESLALRKAFPNDLSGIYTTEEMEQADARVAPVAAASALTDELRATIVSAIAKTTTRPELTELWKQHAAVADIPFINSLGDEITLKSLFISKAQELEAEVAE
jgi:phage recombination protein Bet